VFAAWLVAAASADENWIAAKGTALFSVLNASASVNVRTVLGAVRKDPRSPLFQVGGEKTPWLKDGIYSNLIFNRSDTGNRRFRCYYSASLLCPANNTDCTHGYETGSDCLAYAESSDGITWNTPALGLHAWPPGSTNTANNILFFDEAGTAAFEDEGSMVVAGQLTRNGSSMHAGGSGWYQRSADGINFATKSPKHMLVPSTPGAGVRWDTQVNFIKDERTQQYVGSLRAPRNPACGIWWPSCINPSAQKRGCSSNSSAKGGCGSAPSVLPSSDLVSVRAIAVVKGPSLDLLNQTLTVSTASGCGLPSPTRQVSGLQVQPVQTVL
jgi:hypothetical protein